MKQKNDPVFGSTDYTLIKTAFSLIAEGFSTISSRRTSNAVSTSASFPLQMWVTRAPTTSYTGRSTGQCEIKYGMAILKGSCLRPFFKFFLTI